MSDHFFKHAIVRSPGGDAAAGLTTANLGKLDKSLLLQQHTSYVNTLRDLGLEVEVLPPLSGFPDAYFIEDAAVVFPEIAVIAHSGAPSRQGEQTSVEACLCNYAISTRITEPANLDGGDVLVIDKTCFVGLSERTNELAAKQLADTLAPWNYRVETIDVGDGLHLKSSVNHLGGKRLITTPHLANHPAFAQFERTVVEGDNAYSANSLWVNDVLLTPSGFPETSSKLKNLPMKVIELDVSELQKMDGGLTCLSLRF